MDPVELVAAVWNFVRDYCQSLGGIVTHPQVLLEARFWETALSQPVVRVALGAEVILCAYGTVTRFLLPLWDAWWNAPPEEDR
jgi:hypothetical protein